LLLRGQKFTIFAIKEKSPEQLVQVPGPASWTLIILFSEMLKFSENI
jgi:hypothetical protein